MAEFQYRENQKVHLTIIGILFNFLCSIIVQASNETTWERILSFLLAPDTWCFPTMISLTFGHYLDVHQFNSIQTLPETDADPIIEGLSLIRPLSLQNPVGRLGHLYFWLTGVPATPTRGSCNPQLSFNNLSKWRQNSWRHFTYTNQFIIKNTNEPGKEVHRVMSRKVSRIP